MKNCIFCQIASGEIPSKKVYMDDDMIAFNDIHPVAPVHVLIIPRKHISRLTEATDADQKLLGKIQLVAGRLAKELEIDTAFRVLMANGEKAGQSVFHLHYHVIGGWKKGAPKMETR